jgi:thioredoxin 1
MITRDVWLCRGRDGPVPARKLRRRSTSLSRSRNAGPAAPEGLDLKPLVIAAMSLDVAEGVRKPAEYMGVEVLGKRYPTAASTRGGKNMRTATTAAKGRPSSGVRYAAIRRLLPGLLALLAILMLSTACSQDSASSGNSTSTELEEALASGKPTLAGFVGQVCACKNITPTLEELAAEYEGRCNVLVLDVADCKSLFSEYDVTLVPTQVYFDSSGAEVERIVGASTKEEMIDRLAGAGGA